MKLYNNDGKVVYDDEQLVGPYDNEEDAKDGMSAWEGVILVAKPFFAKLSYDEIQGWWFIAHPKFLSFE